MSNIVAAIESAREASGFSRRELAEMTGISQVALNDVADGNRTATMSEIVLIADALGCAVADLSGNTVADRVTCTPAAIAGEGASEMRQRLLYFLELDAYLDDHAIPAV